MNDFNAAKARELRTDKEQAELTWWLEQIEEAAHKSDRYDFYKPMPEHVQVELVARGFTITLAGGMARQKDNYYGVVRW